MRAEIMNSLLIAMLVLLTPTLAGAGTITVDFGIPLTITTTTEQDKDLERVLADLNAVRASFTRPLPALTVGEYLHDVLSNAVKTAVQEGRRKNALDACAAYTSLPRERQSSIRTELGGKAPCE